MIFLKKMVNSIMLVGDNNAIFEIIETDGQIYQPVEDETNG